MSNKNPYAPKKHAYVASHRYDYYAVDDMVTDEDNKTYPVGSYPFPLTFKSRNDANKISDALNMTFANGMKYERHQAKESERTEGYTNYPTAMVALLIRNNQSIQVRCWQLALESADINALAATLREYVDNDDERPDNLESPWSEFISYCMASVNWYELAEEIWNDARGVNK